MTKQLASRRSPRWAFMERFEVHDYLERLHLELVHQGEDCSVVLDEIGSAA